ncbi:MAG: ScpA family protein [Gammaproteobacteria bacterium]|jgi:segregation and condensation protein A
MTEAEAQQAGTESQANVEAVTSYAKVQGEAITSLPQDLYIPPEALQIFLEAFEGPLDLLLYLIKKQNIDILDIPIAEITRQYMEYVEMMKELHLDLAADYLVMAAMLAEIKSRMLLPRIINEEGEEEDPRAELIRRLQEYERYKQAAEDLNELPRRERDTFAAFADVPKWEVEKPKPQVDYKDLIFAFHDVLKRIELRAHHHIKRKILSVNDRIKRILQQVEAEEFVPFTAFFDFAEGRMGVVVTFIAILELFKSALIEVVQSDAFEQLHIKAAVNAISIVPEDARFTTDKNT